MLRNLVATLRRWYRMVFARQEDARTREIAATLRRVPLFSELPRSALHELADAMHSRAYKRDEFLYYEGDPGLGMYIVQEGRVRLVKEDEERAVHELRQVEETGIFGLLSVFGDFRRLESARAVVDSRVLGFFRPDMKTMIKRNPRTAAYVIAALARNMAAWQSELVHLLAEEQTPVPAVRLFHRAARTLHSYDPHSPAVDQ